MIRSRTLRAVLIAVLLVAGCGRGESVEGAATTAVVPEVTPSTTTTTAPPLSSTAPASTPAVPPPAGVTVPAATAGPARGPDLSAKAGGAVFQQADFPEGFRPHPDGDGGGLHLERIWKEVLGCSGVTTPPPRASATSSTFLRGDGAQARATVEYGVGPSVSLIAALRGPKAQRCITTAFAADLARTAPPGAIPGAVQVASRRGPPKAPQSPAYRITATISLGDSQTPLVQDFYVLFSRGAVIRALFVGTGGEFPVELQHSLLEKLTART